MKEKVLVSWGGGKDSAMALYELQRAHEFDVSALLTVITTDYDRVSMHGIRRVLVEQQAESLGIPMKRISISPKSSNQEYEDRMREILMGFRNGGTFSVAFGDIFLEDIRKYREENLAKVEMKGIFPIWMRNTAELARTFIDLGFKAIITCVDTEVLSGDFVGWPYDAKLLSEIPSSVDPCGENGEFHTFVFDGPIFRRQIPFTKGGTVLRENRFSFCDLIPT